MQINMLENSKSLDLSDSVFAVAYNETLVHQLVVKYLADNRAGTKAQKNRSEVRGGGKKPWRQKGTGRARAGTIRSPLWRKGCIIFAAKPQDHSKKLNKKMYRAGMRSIFSELARQERLKLIETINLETPKTKAIVELLANYSLDKATLIITPEFNENVYLSTRNLKNVGYLPAIDLNPVDLIKYDQILTTKTAVKNIEEQLV